MNHFPKNIQAVLDEGIPKALCKKAGLVGPHFEQLIGDILKPHAFINLRKAQGLVGLMGKYDYSQIEHIAQMILQKGLAVTHKSMKKLIEDYIKELTINQEISISSQTRSFIRAGLYFVHHSSTREV